MNTNATTLQPSAPSGGPRRHRGAAALLALFLTLVASACLITEVIQPSQANRGEVINVSMTVEVPYDDVNPHRGVMSVLVPADWTYVSGTYAGAAGTGNMVEDMGWADSTEIVLPAPNGMKWISALSAEGRSISGAPVFVDATLQLRVGQTMGTFDLGYFTTNDAFATRDIAFGPSDSNTADTLMAQSIVVRPGTASEGGPEDARFRLEPASPNPFRSSTSIAYTLAEGAVVQIAVYDLTGRRVATFVEGRKGPGTHSVRFDARGLSVGAYLYRLEANGSVVHTRRMVLTK